jgi:hypothetical protein
MAEPDEEEDKLAELPFELRTKLREAIADPDVVRESYEQPESLLHILSCRQCYSLVLEDRLVNHWIWHLSLDQAIKGEELPEELD